MSKRDEAIGRAAEEAHDAWSAVRRWGNPENAQAVGPSPWPSVALAAVAEARRLDTCETCKHYEFGDESDGYSQFCSLHAFEADQINICGCNRHQPKE